MKMQLLVKLITLDSYELEEGKRTVSYLIEKTDSDLTGRTFNISTLIEKQAVEKK